MTASIQEPCIVTYAFDAGDVTEQFAIPVTKEIWNSTPNPFHLVDLALTFGVDGGEVSDPLRFNFGQSDTGDFFLAQISDDFIRFKAIDDLIPGDFSIFSYIIYSTVPQGYFIVEHTFRVPEPAALALFGIGVAGIGFLRRRRRN